MTRSVKDVGGRIQKPRRERLLQRQKKDPTDVGGGTRESLKMVEERVRGALRKNDAYVKDTHNPRLIRNPFEGVNKPMRQHEASPNAVEERTGKHHT